MSRKRPRSPSTSQSFRQESSAGSSPSSSADSAAPLLKRSKIEDAMDTLSLQAYMNSMGRLNLSKLAEARRKASRKAHPDAGGNNDLICEVNSAYELLRTRIRTREESELIRNSSADGDGIMRHMIQQCVGNVRASNMGKEGIANISLPISKTSARTLFLQPIVRRGMCPPCLGTGWKHFSELVGDPDVEACKTCGGHGTLVKESERNSISAHSFHMNSCGVCNGCGHHKTSPKYFCMLCNGKKMSEKAEYITIQPDRFFSAHSRITEDGSNTRLTVEWTWDNMEEWEVIVRDGMKTVFLTRTVSWEEQVAMRPLGIFGVEVPHPLGGDSEYLSIPLPAKNASATSEPVSGMSIHGMGVIVCVRWEAPPPDLSGLACDSEEARETLAMISRSIRDPLFLKREWDDIETK